MGLGWSWVYRLELVNPYRRCISKLTICRSGGSTCVFFSSPVSALVVQLCNYKKRSFATLDCLLMLTALVPLSSAAYCTGLRTFSEARRVLWATETLDPTKEASWLHTRPGFANRDVTEHENGTIVPPDRVTWGMVVYGVSEVDTQKQTVCRDSRTRRCPNLLQVLICATRICRNRSRSTCSCAHSGPTLGWHSPRRPQAAASPTHTRLMASWASTVRQMDRSGHLALQS